MGVATKMEKKISAEHQNARRKSVYVAWEQKGEELKEEERRLGRRISNSSDISSNGLAREDNLPPPCSLQRLIHIIRPKTFSDATLEAMYRRYFRNIDHCWLLLSQNVGIIICVIILVYTYVHDYHGAVIGIVLSAIILAFVLLEVLLWSMTMNTLRLTLLSVVTLILYECLVIFSVVKDTPHDVSEGLWFTLFLIYMVYVAIPCGMVVSVISGVTMSLTQTLITRYTEKYDSTEENNRVSTCSTQL